MWEGFISNSDFVLALWSIQRMCYTSICGAYENFVQRTVAAGKRDESYRAKRLAILANAFLLLRQGDAQAIQPAGVNTQLSTSRLT
jgi:hypothetical protein